jgi:hypothetical protein
MKINTNLIMKRKLKQWWSTTSLPPPQITIKTKQNINHFTPETIEHKNDHDKCSGPCLGQILECDGVKAINEFLTLPS